MNGKFVDAGSQSPLTLAFYGDAVYSLLARRYIIDKGNRPVGGLHSAAAELVCAQTQAAAAAAIADMLSEKETAVYKRGRNAKVSHIPKGATQAEYHSATGLETLFGWLSVNGMNERAEELFNAIVERLDK